MTEYGNVFRNFFVGDLDYLSKFWNTDSLTRMVLNHREQNVFIPLAIIKDGNRLMGAIIANKNGTFSGKSNALMIPWDMFIEMVGNGQVDYCKLEGKGRDARVKGDYEKKRISPASPYPKDCSMLFRVLPSFSVGEAQSPFILIAPFKIYKGGRKNNTCVSVLIAGVGCKDKNGIDICRNAYRSFEDYLLSKTSFEYLDRERTILGENYCILSSDIQVWGNHFVYLGGEDENDFKWSGKLRKYNELLGFAEDEDEMHDYTPFLIDNRRTTLKEENMSEYEREAAYVLDRAETRSDWTTSGIEKSYETAISEGNIQKLNALASLLGLYYKMGGNQ